MVIDNGSAPSTPVGADPVIDRTTEKTAIIAMAMATQRLRKAIRASDPAVARMRVMAGFRLRDFG